MALSRLPLDRLLRAREDVAFFDRADEGRLAGLEATEAPALCGLGCANWASAESSATSASACLGIAFLSVIVTLTVAPVSCTLFRAFWYPLAVTIKVTDPVRSSENLKKPRASVIA